MFERGMPEIVAHYSEHKDLVALNAIYESLLVSYLDDVEKYAQHPSQVDYIRHAIRSSFAEPSLLPGIADRKIPGMDRGADWPIMQYNSAGDLYFVSSNSLYETAYRPAFPDRLRCLCTSA